ncbi:MAG TPA: hypothetical protein VGK53_15940 [Propionicimonas sp.]
MRLRTIIATLMAAFALSVAMPAATQTPAQAATCTGVWVVVDYGSLGGISTRCATSYGTGTAALKSAGLPGTLDNGMVVKISGKPGNPDINKAYWSYWHATLQSDGSYSGWSYSNLGAGSYHPSQGNAEGWRYQDLSDGKVAPGASPPKDDPTPTPTPTVTKKPTPKPTQTATKKPTPKPSATATVTTSASAKPSASASRKAGATPTASPTATPAPTPAGTEPATAEAESQVIPAQPAQDNGSPVGAIAVGSIVVAGGAGVGGWWLLKGRRR